MLKNVVVLCDYTYIEGGAAKVAIQTALALDRYTDLNVMYIGGCGEICEALKNSGVKSYSLGEYDLLGNPSKVNAMLKGIWNSTAAKKLKNILCDLDPKETTIHIHTWTKVLSSSVFRLLHKMRFPIFVTIHDYFMVCPNGGCFNYVKNEICELEPMSVKCLCCNCDVRHYYHKIWRCMRQLRQNYTIRRIPDIHYIFISEFSKKQFLRRYSNVVHKHMLRNPIEFGERYRVKAEENEYYLYIGRLSEEKGVSLFCQAIHETGVKGVVIGDGKLKESLMRQYPELTFTGWLNKEEIQKWIEKGRCLIFPSLWYEGAPLTPLEVMAYGIPCVVSNCNAACDYIENGKNGFVFDTDYLNELEDLIVKMQEVQFVYELSKNAFSFFEGGGYQEEKYVNKLLRVYNSSNG